MALPEKKPYERLSAYLERTLPEELKAGKSRGRATAELIAEFNKEPVKRVVKNYFLNKSSGGDAGDVIATGGVVTTEGDYKIHTFTSGVGTFTISSIPFSAATLQASVLVVAGGGAGGAVGAEGGGLNGQGGGGGAGGVVYIPDFSASFTEGSNTITVGDGGIADRTSKTNAQGKDSIISGSLYLIAKGGGHGGDATYYSASEGGSGGGGAGLPISPTYPLYRFGADEIQSAQSGDSSTFGFGNSGGDGRENTQAAGAGGGAGAAGQDADADGGYIGGIGIFTDEFDNTTSPLDPNGYYGGGGSAAGVTGPGALGGGGAGRNGDVTTKNGVDGRGGGGGGGDRSGTGGTGGNGGSGVVKIKYKYKNIA